MKWPRDASLAGHFRDTMILVKHIFRRPTVPARFSFTRFDACDGSSVALRVDDVLEVLRLQSRVVRLEWSSNLKGHHDPRNVRRHDRQRQRPSGNASRIYRHLSGELAIRASVTFLLFLQELPTSCARFLASSLQSCAPHRLSPTPSTASTDCKQQQYAHLRPEAVRAPNGADQGVPDPAGLATRTPGSAAQGLCSRQVCRPCRERDRHQEEGDKAAETDLTLETRIGYGPRQMHQGEVPAGLTLGGP